MRFVSPPLLALTLAIATASYAIVFHDEEAERYRLWYYTPAAALAGAFIAERRGTRNIGRRALAVDVLVALLCLARPLTGQPPVSGHAWFAVHALLTMEGVSSRCLAVLVLVITLYAKLILWHGDATLWPGLIAGLLSGLLWRRWHVARGLGAQACPPCHAPAGHRKPPGGTTSGVDRLMTLAEADALTSSLRPLGTEAVTLAECLGRTLATALMADRPFPPYRRAMMDGIAFATESLPATGPVILSGLHAAGEPPPDPLTPGHAWEIMTGAVVPDDCDTVVPYEDLEGGRPKPGFKKGQFIHEAGSDAAAGAVLVNAGTPVGPVEVAIAASVGLTGVEVFRRAKVAILSTGDEAVPPGAVPQPWEIRRSNGPMLEAMLVRRGYEIVFHDHAPDDLATCGRLLDEALATCDVLLICGGISKGKKDFIRGVLEERLGKPAFHGVEQRPGKPLAFWSGSPVVFALPGNPVSVLATFTRHVLPALSRLEGRMFSPLKVRMNESPAPLPKFSWLLTVAMAPDGTLRARPPSNSGDFISVAGSCGIVEVPPGSAADAFDFYPFP